MIDPNHPFVALLDCSVSYSGRASSLLARGYYLIIYKHDQSLSVHGNNNIGPRNYQGSKTKLSVVDNIITAINKKETMTITVHNEIWNQSVPSWSNHPVMVTRTEKELVIKIATNPIRYLGFEPDLIHLEFPTPNGPVDIVAVKDTIHHVIEVKRRIISTNNIIQLKKYLECINFQTVGYVAGPGISDSAKKYLEKCALKYIEVTWD